MSPAKNDREARAARQRLRDYQARQTLHANQVNRRKRDNIIAAICVLVIVAAATTAQVFYFSGGPGTPTPTPSATSTTDPTSTPEAEPNSDLVPDPALAEARDWTGTMALNDIDLGLLLDGKDAPQSTANFISLAKAGFFTGVTCHRLTTEGIYVLQCGDPSGNGTGGPGYTYGPIENAPSDNVYPAGTLAMARPGNTASGMGSQFFIVYQDSQIPADSVGGYTIFGTVTSGLDALKSSVIDAGVAGGASDGAPVVPVTIGQITVQ